MNTNQSFANALEEKTVIAKIMGIDYHRSFAAFGSVDTHYIIQVRPSASSKKHSRFASFRIEKSFKDFRNLVTEFNRATNETTDGFKDKGHSWENIPESTQSFIAFSDAFSHVIDQSPKTYLAKMSFHLVEKVAEERQDILQKALQIMLENYPDDKHSQTAQPVDLFKRIVTNFFLTDHISDDDDDIDNDGIVYDDFDYGLIAVEPSSAHNMPADSSNNGFVDTVVQRNLSHEKETAPIVPNHPPIADLRETPTMSNASVKSIKSISYDESVKSLNSIKSISSIKSVKSKSCDESPEMTPVRPTSSKKRLSQKARIENENVFMRSNTLHIDDGDENRMLSNAENNGILDDPKKVISILVAATHFFLFIPETTITLRLDILILLFYTFFVSGIRLTKSPDKEEEDMEMDEPMTMMYQNRNRADSATMARRVFLGEKVENRKMTNKNVGFSLANKTVGFSMDSNLINGVLQRFPDGARLGSVSNCWSPSAHSEFNVRGANYLKDRVKVPSGNFIFPPRGVEMFLSDCCPGNIGRYKVMMNQKLRDKPSFIINFRLPWGNCVFTSEIPSKFLPFLSHRYCPTSSTAPSMEGMTPQEICTCRFLMGDDNHKCQTLKIIPSVVKGPWIMKKVADNKPAIVGSKMPSHYIYEPANPEKGLSEYLEMDLDIVASSAARGILSVAQRYTKTLTLDLGFVIQGNQEDELPEQLLVAMRLHSLDPVIAPSLPEEENSIRW